MKGRGSERVLGARMPLLALAALSMIVIGALFAWEGRKGFDLWDEGFLWYGAQRVLAGEVPIRDFMAYEPARYYWAAGWMQALSSSGVVALRISSAVLAAGTLFLALAALRAGRTRLTLPFLVAAALVLAAWMVPYFKVADIAASVFLIANFAFLIASPDRQRYFLAGVGVGLAAVIGRNHGVYGLAGGCAILLWLNFRSTRGPGLWRAAAWSAAGVVTGFLPMVLMLLWVPGFAAEFLRSVLSLRDLKGTNLTIPVPWPWKVDGSTSNTVIAHGLAVGFVFVLLPISSIGSMAVVVWRRARDLPTSPAIVAAAFLSLPYAHYAYSRADSVHLALGIFPFLICVIGAIAAFRSPSRWVAIGLLLLASVLAIHRDHPGWQCRAGADCMQVDVWGDPIRMSNSTAKDVELLKMLAAQYAQYARDGRSALVVPLWPGAYALLNQKSPMWEIYALFGRSEAFQREEIERIRRSNPGFAFVYDEALDGKAELRFSRTHPLIDDYIAKNFVRKDYPFRSDYQVFVAKDHPALSERPRYLDLGAERAGRLATAAARFKVKAWGPQSAVAGEIPNLQPGGTAGIWIQAEVDAEVGDLRLYFDGQPASVTSLGPGTITAAVPAALFEKPGVKNIHLLQVLTGTMLPVGQFEVVAK